MADAIANAIFGMLFDYSTEALFIIDRTTGCVVSANVRVADMLARDVDMVIGSRLDELSLEPERDLTVPGHYEDVALRRDDDYPVHVTLFVAHIDLPPDQSFAAYTARDMTERRSLERELVAKHSALFGAYADLERAYAQLHDTKQELETRNREIAMLAWRAAVGELVAGIAHHLNNPVGALASTLRRMGSVVGRVEGEPKVELQRLLERVGQIANRIESNVSAIVQASRSATASEQQRGRFELPHEIAHVLTNFSDRLDDIPTKESP